MQPDALKDIYKAMWPDDTERATRLLDLYFGLMEAGRWRTCVDLMRGVGIRESSVWKMIKLGAARIDADLGEVFREIYEPGGLDNE